MKGAPSRGTVVVTWPDFRPDDPETGGRLRSAGLELCLAPKLGARSPADVAALVGDAVAAIVSTDPFDAGVFRAARQLRVVARVGVGFDSIDVDAATAAGVAVTTTPGANESTVADHTVGLMLSALRRIVEHDRSVRRGEWNRTGPHVPWDLAGATVGLIGFGAIGRRVAQRLAGFVPRLLVCDPALEQDAEQRRSHRANRARPDGRPVPAGPAQCGRWRSGGGSRGAQRDVGEGLGALVVERVQGVNDEPAALDALGDEPVEVATARDAAIDRLQPVLPARHRRVGGAAVLDEVQ